MSHASAPGSVDVCMSRGPNQHYLPKFLQKPFAVPPKRNQIWYFGRDSRAVKQRIKRTASQANFYSHPAPAGQRTLDDEITDSESDLALALNSIRSKSVGERVDPNFAADLIQHLSPRTAHVRDTMQQGVMKLIDTAADRYVDSDDILTLFGLDSNQPTDRFRETILDTLLRRPEIQRADIPVQALEGFAFCITRENLPEILRERESRLAIRSAVHDMLPDSADFVRKSHNEYLVEIVKPGPRDPLLLELEWTIKDAPAAGAILPDFVVMAISDDGMAGPLVYVLGERVHTVIMPVTPAKFLVGRKNGSTLPHDFDFNREAARASQSFFLSSAENAETARVHPLVGERVPLLVEEVIAAAVHDSEAGKEADTRHVDSPGRSQPESGRAPEFGGTFEYDIWLIECADREGTKRLGEKINALVSALSQALPLERLHGITIARDYPAAVGALDRGFDTENQLKPVSPEIGVGIAQTVTIMHSGRLMCRVIVSDSVAHDLLSHDPERVGWAVHVLVHQLAEVGMIGTVEQVFPGSTLTHPNSRLDRELYAILYPGLIVHVASHMAAGFGDTEAVADMLRGFLVQSIEYMATRVPNERQAYHRHRDIDRLVAVAFPAVRHVLILAAQLLGHCAAASISPMGDSRALSDILDREDLTNWFRTYESDLERFRNRLGQWASFDEFTAFNIHVERLLWHIRIVPSEDSGRVGINVLTGDHAHEPSSTSERGERSRSLI